MLSTWLVSDNDSLVALVILVTKVVFIWFLHCQVTPPTLPTFLTFWKEVTIYNLYLIKQQEVNSLSPWQWGIHINYLDFFCVGDCLFLLIHSFIHSCQYELVDIYFILRVIIQHCFILFKLFQLGLWELF